MMEAGQGRIASVGSMFGSIGFPYFSAYSASKFALRGFCEALRRELADTGVGVTYISPRATRTPINTSKVMAMAEATGMNMDSPELVARCIVQAIEGDRDEAYVGQPESLFAKINGLLPGLVGRFIGKQRRAMEPFARV
jgi:short-subunit dehydrogenase